MISGRVPTTTHQRTRPVNSSHPASQEDARNIAEQLSFPRSHRAPTEDGGSNDEACPEPEMSLSIREKYRERRHREGADSREKGP